MTQCSHEDSAAEQSRAENRQRDDEARETAQHLAPLGDLVKVLTATSRGYPA